MPLLLAVLVGVGAAVAARGYGRPVSVGAGLVGLVVAVLVLRLVFSSAA